MAKKVHVDNLSYPISKSYMGRSPGFREMGARLLHYLNERVRRGEITERGLARLTGYSQPHIHNVLKGARLIQMELGDRIMDLLAIPLTALLTQDELEGRAPREPTHGVPVPILDGYLGNRSPYPQLSSAGDRRFFPGSALAGMISPVLARVHEKERSMWPLIWPGDLVLLDRSPAERRRPMFESIYTLCWAKKGIIARCRRVGTALVVVVDDPGDHPAVSHPISLENRNILDIVQGKIVWLGREFAGPV